MKQVRVYNINLQGSHNLVIKSMGGENFVVYGYMLPCYARCFLMGSVAAYYVKARPDTTFVASGAG